MAKKILIVAGEASGDVHAAEVVQAMNSQTRELAFFGIAGPKMREQGIEALINAEDISLMGFAEVVMNFGLVWRMYQTIKTTLIERQPDLVILVDYPGFNLRVAKLAKQLGIKVFYYISPQLWAWRQGRVKQIKRYVDHMAVIFPFEKKFYDQHGVPATYVGCPLLDELDFELTQAQAREQLALKQDQTIITLLPGSRQAVVERGLSVMLQAGRQLIKRLGVVQFVLPVANTLSKDRVAALCPDDFPLKLVEGHSYEAIKAANAVICSSGTATLETALLGVPMVVLYKMNSITYQIIKRLIKIKDISLCNIVAERQIVKEFLQAQAKPDVIANEIVTILTDANYRQTMEQNLIALRHKMGEPGAAERVAQLALNLLES